MLPETGHRREDFPVSAGGPLREGKDLPVERFRRPGSGAAMNGIPQLDHIVKQIPALITPGKVRKQGLRLAVSQVTVEVPADIQLILFTVHVFFLSLKSGANREASAFLALKILDLTALSVNPVAVAISA